MDEFSDRKVKKGDIIRLDITFGSSWIYPGLWKVLQAETDVNDHVLLLLRKMDEFGGLTDYPSTIPGAEGCPVSELHVVVPCSAIKVVKRAEGE